MILSREQERRIVLRHRNQAIAVVVVGFLLFLAWYLTPDCAECALPLRTKIEATFAIPAYDADAPGSCAPGLLPVSRPLVLCVASAWPWRPFRYEIEVTPGDTVLWQHSTREPVGTFYVFRAWVYDRGGASCSTLMLRKAVLDLTPPGPVILRTR